jgi:hypothetical protein
MEITENLHAYGHRNIQATHKTTLEVTKENELTRKGDCIIGVSANKALTTLSHEFKDNLQKKNAKVIILIKAGDMVDVVSASGSNELILTHPTDMVVRKSSYICNRTLAIKADKAACDLSKELVERLKKPEQKVTVTLTVKV